MFIRFFHKPCLDHSNVRDILNILILFLIKCHIFRTDSKSLAMLWFFFDTNGERNNIRILLHHAKHKSWCKMYSLYNHWLILLCILSYNLYWINVTINFMILFIYFFLSFFLCWSVFKNICFGKSKAKLYFWWVFLMRNFLK